MRWGFLFLLYATVMAMRLTWLLLALVLAALMLGVHLYALDNYLYWYYRWLDIPMHVLGGAVMAAAVIGVLRSFRPITFVLVIAAGAIGWEVFEYLFHISTGQPDYLWDTLHDIVNDAFGALVVYVVARYSVWRSR